MGMPMNIKKPVPPQAAGPAQPPQGGPPAASPQMPPQAAAGMPGTPPGQPMVSGEEVQGLMFSRLGQMSDEELNMLGSIVTEETVSVLFKLLPELGIFFEEALKFNGSQQQGVTGQQGESEARIPKGDGEESDNPLVNPKISRGLMGY